MSKIVFDFPHLDNAQEIFKAIQKDYNNFDWSGPNADRTKNWRALQKVLTYPEVNEQIEGKIRLFEVRLENGDVACSFYYYEDRMCTFVDLYPDGIEQVFDFNNPIDILDILDGAVEKAEEMKMFYQIKVA